MKIALLVAYDGTDFKGFARQRDQRTVQGVIEERLSFLFHASTSITGAGRTDAGVHAWGQVVSFVAPEGTESAWVMERLNRWVAPEIAIRAAAVVLESFDARFSAVRRGYEYRIYRSDVPSPFEDRFALHVPGKLSLGAMRAGAKALIGEHDFSAFCRKGQGPSIRRVRAIRLVASGDRLTFKVEADSFCHQMVRSVAGLLLEVGRKTRPVEDVARVLALRERSAAGPVAPARGLHLVGVLYPSSLF